MAINAHAAMKARRGMYQSPPGSSRLRAAKLPYGAVGRVVCNRSSHPMNGIAGLEISGLRPSRHAHKYQSTNAAGLSQIPTAKSADKTEPKISNTVTNPGSSQIASRLGNKVTSGLDEARPNAPRFENSSAPQGSNSKKC